MAWNVCSSDDSFLIQAITSQLPERIDCIIQQLLSNRNLYSQQALNYCLSHSSRNGPCVLVQTLLSAGAHIETRDERGYTPLVLSVANNQINISRLLLSKGANVNAPNNDGETALILSTFFSASHGTTKLLLDNRDINTEHRNVNGFTALACAIQAQNLEAIKLLIGANACIDKPSYDICLNGGYDVFHNLPEKVLDIAKRNGIFNLVCLFKLEKDIGQTAVLLAAEKIDSRSIHYLTSMDNTVLNYDSGTYLQALNKILASINSLPIRDNEINIVEMLTQTYVTLPKLPGDKTLEATAFKRAAKLGDPLIIELLCQSGLVIPNKVLGSVAASGNYVLLDKLVKHEAKVCEVNDTDDRGQKKYQGSALDKAIRSEQFECAKLLINCGAFLDISLASELAVKSSKEKCFEFLFNERPVETRSTIMSSNLLHVAVMGGNINIINMLLDKGADVNKVDDNNSPLMRAVDLTVVDLLVARGADVNMVIDSNFPFKFVLNYFVSDKYRRYLREKLTVKDDKGIDMPHSALIKRLIFNGSSVSERDFFDRTPLMLAAETADSCEVIKVLLEAGADIKESRRESHTALHNAFQYNQIENAKCLMAYGADVNAGSETGNSVLFICSKVELLKHVIQHKANINAEDGLGNNVLMHHLELWSMNEEMITALIDALIHCFPRP